MCFEDVKLGRKAAFRETVVAVAGTATQLVSADARRIALIIGTSTLDNLTVSTLRSVAVGAGIGLTVGTPGLLMTIQDYGQLVTAAWFGVSDAPGQSHSIIEVFLPVDPVES